jgi:hypothetical protein
MPCNLNSHNHNQHAGRPCFSLAVQIARSSLLHATIFPSSEAVHHTSGACDSCARRLLTAGSVNDGRTVVGLLKTEPLAGDADDNRTASYASPTARFTELG